jgi:hypothetical protein
MFALLDPAVTAPPTFSDTLQGIGDAFNDAVTRNGGAGMAVATALLAGVVALAVFRWVRRDVRAEELERTARDARHEAAVSVAPLPLPADGRPHWAQVAVHLRLGLLRTAAHGRVLCEDVETQSLSAGEVSFLSHAPPVPATVLELALYLPGEGWPLALRGVVGPVDGPPAPDAPSLVAVKLGPLTGRESERLARWVAQEDLRQVAQMRRGRVCTCCHRPLADDSAPMHGTCASGRRTAA